MENIPLNIPLENGLFYSACGGMGLLLEPRPSVEILDRTEEITLTLAVGV